MMMLVYLYPFVAVLFVVTLIRGIRRIVNKEDIETHEIVAALSFAYLVTVPWLFR